MSSGTFESVGKTEIENAGKAGLVQVQGKISAVLGTILICKHLMDLLFSYNFFWVKLSNLICS